MSRRTHLADAAIATLAAHGMRGLTHRAVDRKAELPEGSTSYYFRTRLALLEAIVDRLAETTADELGDTPLGLDDLADVAAARLYAWMTHDRERHLARYEISLEAMRRPELRAIFDASRARIRGQVAAAFAEHGAADPAAHASDFVACMDGLLFDVIVGGRTPVPEPDELRETVRRLLASTFGPSVEVPTDAPLFDRAPRYAGRDPNGEP